MLTVSQWIYVASGFAALFSLYQIYLSIHDGWGKDSVNAEIFSRVNPDPRDDPEFQKILKKNQRTSTRVMVVNMLLFCLTAIIIVLTIKNDSDNDKTINGMKKNILDISPLTLSENNIENILDMFSGINLGSLYLVDLSNNNSKIVNDIKKHAIARRISVGSISCWNDPQDAGKYINVGESKNFRYYDTFINENHTKKVSDYLNSIKINSKVEPGYDKIPNNCTGYTDSSTGVPSYTLYISNN